MRKNLSTQNLENWKDIIGYEGLYKISDLGRIKSIRKNYERDVKLTLSHNGYNKVHLSKNNKGKSYRLGRLVAIHFRKKPNIECQHELQINHINGIKTDDRVDNLEWCTPSDNILLAYQSGLIDNTCKFKKNDYPPKQLQML